MSDTTTDVTTSGKSITMTATRNDLTIESQKDNIVLTSRKDVDVSSTINNISLNAKHCVDISTEQKSINLTSVAGRINIKADDSLKFRTTYGDVLVKSDRGSTNVETYTDMEILAEQGNITVEAPNGTINIRALNNINITPGDTGIVNVAGGLHAVTVSQGTPGYNGLLVPTGTLVPYCGTSSPAGWFICDGSAYSNITYVELFEVIGYTFGGEGIYFNVPDMRGRLPLGTSSGLGGFTNKSMGDTGGSETHTLTYNEMPAHTHSVNTDIEGWSTSSYEVGGAPVRPDRGTNYVTTTSAGNGQPHSIMQPYMALNFIIKF